MSAIRTQPVSLPAITCLFFFLDFLFQTVIRHLIYAEAAPLALFDALLYTGLLWITLRVDLAKITLLYLALPYFIFFPGWLNFPTALTLTLLLLFSIAASFRGISAPSLSTITWGEVLAFILILTIVNISGAGGYGYQYSDYDIHNARLHDLATKPWPIRYGENQNFVYYFGYFLPSALLGKLTTINIAVKSMYPWTVLGVALAIRWLGLLSNWKFTIGLSLLFFLFGPLDILNAITVELQTTTSILDSIRNSLLNSNSWYVMNYYFEFFIGGYIPNMVQLDWSPQQVIAGWLGIGCISYLYFSHQYQHMFFIYSLLCLWAPFPMIAMFPFILVGLLFYWRNNNARSSIVVHFLTPCLIIGVFVCFYLSGSRDANLSYWLYDEFDYRGVKIDWAIKAPVLVLYFLFSWGLYCLVCLPFILTRDRKHVIWYCVLILSLFLLPQFIFGAWSDLLCRGSAPLMFLLLVFLLQAVRHYWHTGAKWASIIIFTLFILGSQSFIYHSAKSIFDYGNTEPIGSSLNSHLNAYPNFGPDNTFFETWLRRPLPK